jgi:hypothetical protein
MNKWFSNHELRYMKRQKAGKKLKFSAHEAPDVCVKRLTVKGAHYAITVGKAVSIRKNGDYIDVHKHL